MTSRRNKILFNPLLIIRMSRLEENYSKKVDDIRQDAALRAAEKEKELQEQVRL